MLTSHRCTLIGKPFSIQATDAVLGSTLYFNNALTDLTNVYAGGASLATTYILATSGGILTSAAQTNVFYVNNNDYSIEAESELTASIHNTRLLTATLNSVTCALNFDAYMFYVPSTGKVYGFNAAVGDTYTYLSNIQAVDPLNS